MKHGQKTKSSQGKKSIFLLMLKSKSRNQSANRTSLRGHDNDPPNSQKLSKCSMNIGKYYRTNKYESNFGRAGRILDVA